jgi:hypothetical protein
LLQTAKAAMHQDGYELYRPQLVVSLAQGLAKAGQPDTACSAEIAWEKARGRVVDLMDLLVVKGKILISMSQQEASEGSHACCRCLRRRGGGTAQRYQPRGSLG